MRVVSVCVCAAALCVHLRSTAGTRGIYSSARDALAAQALVDSRALAAGAMWRCRMMTAPWAARWGHTTVIDAAGAIYVIGGNGRGGTDYNDVWASTDGGAQAELG